MEIKDLVQKSHENAVEKGFWEDWNLYDAQEINLNNISKIKCDYNNALGNRLMLIVSELAEAQDALRKGDWENFKEELADVAIRLGDLCGGLNIDLGAEVLKKMERNKQRPYKHGKQF